MNDEKKSVVILLAGGIGSGKSAVRRILEGMGVPCYDADSAVKGFYVESGDGVWHGSRQGSEVLGGAMNGSSDKAGKPFLLPKIETALGQKFRMADGSFDNKALATVIFNDAAKLKAVENIVFPALVEDFEKWREAMSRGFAAVSDKEASSANASSVKALPDVVVFEAATALDKPDFPRLWDKCLWVDAPEELRIERVMTRDHCTREQVLSRLRLQSPLDAHRNEIDAIILNDCSLPELSERVRTALSSIISLSTLYK